MMRYSGDRATNWLELIEEEGVRGWVGSSMMQKSWSWMGPEVKKETWSWAGPMVMMETGY